MSEILGYKFYLNFKNEGSFGRLEITECVGVDGSSFVIEQESKRYGRDVYKFNEEINLSFYKGVFDATDTFQQLPNGTVIHNLTQGFEWLIETKKIHGFESDVDFEIEKDGVLFIPSNLDFQTSESDDYTYFTCKAVQTQDKQLIKRRSDIVTDIFSTEDLDGNEVTPAETQNILLKAKPVRQISKWSTPTPYTVQVGAGQMYFNYIQNIESFGVENSLAFLDSVYYNDISNLSNFVYIDAQSELSDIKLSITNIDYFIDLEAPQFIFIDFKIYYNIGATFDYSNRVLIHSEFKSLVGVPNTHNFIYDGLTNIPFIQNGEKLWIWFEFDAGTNNPLTSANNFVSFDNSGAIEINATSTAIDSVIKGVRYVDVFKENVKRINGFEVDASRFDVGGEYYDQFAFTGNLIKQRNDVPFPVKFSERMEDLQELNCDYQVTDKVYIGQYQDFYPNYEIGVFVSAPDDTFKGTFNDRYAINEYSMSYDNYEQDREEDNTTDAIHTESQWLLSNKQVENTKEIKIKLIRDAYKIESIRKLGLKDTTSTDDDDKLAVIDVVALSPSAIGGFTSVLKHNVNSDGNVQLLRTELFSWSLLGFGVGSIFEIVLSENVGNYTVLEITDSLLLLEPIGFIPTFTGETFTQVSYSYSNVSLVNRTDEGLEYFENLINGDDFSNLRYSIKRNMKTWFPYLATASKFSPNGTFKNTYFKDNGECITRFTGEPENIQENANILNADLGDAILTPYQYETRLVVPFEDALNFLIANDTVNPDNTIGGFARCIDNNGRVIKLYSAKFDYIPATETLRLTGEQRFEGDDLTLTISSTEVIINEVGYPLETLADVWYIMEGDFLTIYDTNGLPVINETKYDLVVVNGLTFDSAIELMNYLTSI